MSEEQAQTMEHAESIVQQEPGTTVEPDAPEPADDIATLDSTTADPEDGMQDFLDEFVANPQEDEHLDEDAGVPDESSADPAQPQLDGEQQTDDQQAAAEEDLPPAPAETQPETSPEAKADEQPAPPADAPPSVQDVLASMGLLPQGYEQPAGQVPSQPQGIQQNPAVAQPPAPVQQPQMPVQQMPAPQPVQPVAQGVQPPPVQNEAEQFSRQQHLDTLATEHFKLDDKVVEALEAEGNEQLAEILPKLMAQTFADAVQATTHVLSQSIPTMVQDTQAQQMQAQKAEEAFYTFWDSRGYNLREYDQDLTNIGNAFLTANPNAQLADCIPNIGAQLILAKQIMPNIMPEISQTNGQGQGQVANPQQGANVPAFRSGVNAPAGPTPMPPANSFRSFFDEMEHVEDIEDMH